MAALVDQETGVRGYLLSGEDRFLGPYRVGLKAYEAALANSIPGAPPRISAHRRLTARPFAPVTALVDQETGVRGYLLSGDDRFLGPYRVGLKAYEAALANSKTAANLTLDNPAQQKRLDRLDVLVSRWNEAVAQREISLMSQVSTQEQARRIEASGVGKQSMDSIRALVNEIGNIERDLLATRATDQERALKTANLALAIGAAASLLFAAVTGYLLKQGVARQIAKLTTVMQRLAKGEAQVEVPGVGRRDEIGQMAESLEVFKRNTADKQVLEALLMRSL